MATEAATTTEAALPGVTSDIADNLWKRRSQKLESTLEDYAGAASGSSEEKRAGRKLDRIARRQERRDAPEPEPEPASKSKSPLSPAIRPGTVALRDPKGRTFSFHQYLNYLKGKDA